MGKTDAFFDKATRDKLEKLNPEIGIKSSDRDEVEKKLAEMQDMIQMWLGLK